jgi:4-hydroxy-tetrahydrodipicolinate reductase
MSRTICLAGATGKVGRELVRAVVEADDLELVACVGRATAGRRLPAVLPFACPDLPIHATVAEAHAAAPFDVLVDYTKPDAVFANVAEAVRLGAHAVIGTSGLTDGDYERLDAAAREASVGVFAAGNFSITATLMMHCARVVARHVPHWEIIDYAPDTKPDAPSGTGREFAHLLGGAEGPRYAVPPDEVAGDPASRGATLNGSQVHSVRVPGFYSSAEAIFGLPGERLTIRHDSISYAPYVAGTLLAARRVGGTVGVTRGLANLLDLGGT